MKRTAKTTFRSVRWEETEIAAAEGLSKMTRASCEQAYAGDITGTSTLEYLMVYRHGGEATFVGMERVVGSVLGRNGSFVLEHRGIFVAGVARMTLRVIEGAGTGDLRSLSGEGTFESPHADAYELTLSCTFDERA